MFTDNDLTRMATRVGRAIGPVAVGTFGSYAMGTAKDTSDVDLFVIHERANEPRFSGHLVRRHLTGVLWPLDIHVFEPNDFERQALEHHSFEWIIVRQAKLYYWRHDAPRIVPSLFAQSP
jgi:predicted nucleotidyltransferase